MKRSSQYSWKELPSELKRRKVYPVIAAYAVIAFILLQIGEITFAPLGLPNWVMVGLIFLVIIGFPVTVILAWLFDITPTGIQADRGPETQTEEGEQKPSIAVLPFVDMSPDKDQGYFCEGVAEEILNALTKIQELSVAARSSSFQYKSGVGDIRKIGREISVSAILEGSVRKFDNQLRITAQLVKVSDGYHLWSKSFDEEIKDIFAIQDEIARSIAMALLETLSPKDQSSLVTTSSSDISAYEYYLRGKQFFKFFRKKDTEYASQMFNKALTIDPDFILAWTGYADCHSFLNMYSDPHPTHKTEATRASVRAVEIDPDLAEAHASRGLAHLVCEEFELAEDQFKKALELNPTLFEAYYYYGRTQFHRGNINEAAELFKQASIVDPTDYQSRCLRVQILRGMGRMEEATAEAKDAIRVIKKQLEWHPDDARAYLLGMGSLIVLEDKELAKEWLQRAITISPDDSVNLYNAACNMVTLGELDKAMDYLESAFQHGAVSSDWMRNDEDLRLLRTHPRYEKLLHKVKINESLSKGVW